MLSIYKCKLYQVDAILVEVHEETKASVIELLIESGFEIKSISDPAPPTFCLRSSPHPVDFDARLNTYLIFAKQIVPYMPTE